CAMSTASTRQLWKPRWLVTQTRRASSWNDICRRRRASCWNHGCFPAAQRGRLTKNLAERRISRVSEKCANAGRGNMTADTTDRFDYIVVGAGTAGCIVAERLSRDPRNKVLILEAGGNDSWIWFHIPVGYLFAIGNERSDWCFQTDEEPGLNGRSLGYPRGKVIGGSSSINAMISMRGQAGDYDYWNSLGLPGWAWSDVLPWFRKLEDHFLGESEFHGVGGRWRVEPPRVRWDVLDAVAKAAQELGIPANCDFNTGDNEGVGYFHVNQKRERCWSAARGFLKPSLKRSNLRLQTYALVERLIFDGKRVRGVRYQVGDKTFAAEASGEVIISAGSIGSVQILQRSGLGPASELAALGI